MWPFKRKPFLDPETADWHIENFEWLVKCFAKSKALTRSQLILPKPGFFPNNGETGHALAEIIFEQIKQYALIDWPVKLVQRAPIRTKGSVEFEVLKSRCILGTFRSNLHSIPEISYAANLVEQPVSLVATLAHELGHYVIHGAPALPVCANDEIEFLTDLTAVYLGFGIFMANSAFGTQSWRDGLNDNKSVTLSRQGYLPEADLIFANALFVAVKGLDPENARSSLKPRLIKQFDAALLDLEDRRDDVQRIAAYELP
jgi:hypothetical protein